MNILNRRKVLVTTNYQIFIKTIYLLDYENINYSYNVNNRIGVIFKTIEMDLNSIFHIYVHKYDYEKACFVIRSIFN